MPTKQGNTVELSDLGTMQMYLLFSPAFTGAQRVVDLLVLQTGGALEECK